MDRFNIICGVCSVAGMAVSIFTAGKVVKIPKAFNSGNTDDYSKVVNRGSRNTYSGSYTGRDSISGIGSGKKE